jgi:hypothetical protein
MSTWIVQIAGVEEERIEAGVLATESGTLVALSDEGLLLRAWAPGSWRTVRHVTGADAHPAGKGRGEDNVIGLPGLQRV